jgi:hypothetical protein
MADDVITGEKSPIAALFLNLCLFGCVGYFYLGQWQKGLVTLAIVLFTSGGGLIISIITAIDGYMQAKILEEGGAIKHWSFFSNGA